jgi:hypothetical protein
MCGFAHAHRMGRPQGRRDFKRVDALARAASPSTDGTTSLVLFREKEALNRRAAGSVYRLHEQPPNFQGEDFLDEGSREGRIFVGLRKFEAKQDAVFAVPERDPSLREASPRAGANSFMQPAPAQDDHSFNRNPKL